MSLLGYVHLVLSVVLVGGGFALGYWFKKQAEAKVLKAVAPVVAAAKAVEADVKKV